MAAPDHGQSRTVRENALMQAELPEFVATDVRVPGATYGAT